MGKGRRRTCCGEPECTRLRHNQNQRAWHKTPKGQAAAAKGIAKQRAQYETPIHVCEHCRVEYGPYHSKRGPYCTLECKWDDVLLGQLLTMEASEKLLREFGFERIPVAHLNGFADDAKNWVFNPDNWSSSTLISDFSE